ncbi:MAG: DUF1800 domain-containing protein [Bacteroidetes bacterium]|nr:MAG: DUF1800 domain-containing protein [Bacteroidota bacterium]
MLLQNHLFWRSGFGPTPQMQNQAKAFTAKKYWDAVWQSAEKAPMPLQVTQSMADGMMNGLGQPGGQAQMESEASREVLRKQSRQNIRNLNLLWINEMVESPAQLREKMSLFWHGHFACRSLNAFFQQQLLHSIRENALGSFATLLREVSKSPAMLQFLNNQQNRKNSPNENFAREVMELFTLGRGNYSEKDVKEAARAFTGWSFDLSGQFIFRKGIHDGGQKTLLGKTGNFNGDDVIDVLLAKEQTAAFITNKIYRFLVNDAPNPDHIKWLSKRFFESQYSIQKLLEDIFTASWFYDKANIGNRIKSPVELLVGLRRQMPMKLHNEASQLVFQRALGQVLMYPPNVAGWPGGQNWIDASALMFRMRLPQILAQGQAINLKTKGDDDADMGRMQPADSPILPAVAARQRGVATINWEEIVAAFANVNRENLYQQLGESLLQMRPLPPKATLEAFAQKESREQYISSIMVWLMSTPEYQLC